VADFLFDPLDLPEPDLVNLLSGQVRGRMSSQVVGVHVGTLVEPPQARIVGRAGHQRFEQGDSFWERFPGCLAHTGYADTLCQIERCSAVRILRLQVRTVLGEEFHEDGEAPLCRAMQGGLVRYGRRTCSASVTRSLTSAT